MFSTQPCHSYDVFTRNSDDLLCLQLHTVRSPYTVHASNPFWWLAVPTAARSSLAIFLAIFQLCNSPSYNLPTNQTSPHPPSVLPSSCHLLWWHLAMYSQVAYSKCVIALEISDSIAVLLVQQTVSPSVDSIAVLLVQQTVSPSVACLRVKSL
jgi:hypothetical protein